MSSDSKEVEELSDGWVLCRSKSNPGRQYYFHRKTGKSSWTKPQVGDKVVTKSKKKEPPNQQQGKRKCEETPNNSTKRKSDVAEAGSSTKKAKAETSGKGSKKKKPKTTVRKIQPNNKPDSTTQPTFFNKSPTKHTSLDETLSKHRPLNKSLPKRTLLNQPTSNCTSWNAQKTAPAQNKDATSKVTPNKNFASNRLSQLRAQLVGEVKNKPEDDSSPKKNLSSPNQAENETSVRPRNANKLQRPSPTANEPVGSTTGKSPSSNSFHLIPSPSQFFAANKIICSMKAQLPENYCYTEKPKDTFADIERGICSQITKYPVIKHLSTPPQFSQASKLVSAIKSKLSYTPKDIKTFSSAKERMEAFRASLSGDIDEGDLQDDSIADSHIPEAPMNSLIRLAPYTPQKCEAMEVEDIKESNEAPTPMGFQPKDKDPDNGHVVLVVDTNIFIHELDFIKNVLNSHIKGYREQPMLLVPWRVINELDRLKDNNNGSGAVCKRARAAMDYLYNSLPENNRIKGQSLRDANSHIYPCELPDDEILNCALQQAERGRSVLLLSNDRNLCNKAVVNGIRRCAVAELRSLMEHQPQPPAGLDLATRFRRYEHTMYQLLANMLENEMRVKYNNLWRHVVLKPPPWQLADVLQCLLKHWTAVFSEVFPRIEHLIIDLKDTHARLQRKDPTTFTESEVSSFKELCSDVARRCRIIPEYMELAKLTVERLALASGPEDERAREEVVAAFEALWHVLSVYSAKMATAFGVPSALRDHYPVNEPVNNLIEKLPEVDDSIANVIMALKGVLNIEDTSSMDEKTSRLGAVLRETLRLTNYENRPTYEALREFCVTSRDMLQEAVSRFTSLAVMLDLCKSYLPQLVQ